MSTLNKLNLPLVVRYPTAGAYSSAAMKAKEHYDIGVPAPRLRIFVKAPWTDATRRTPF